jgi:hypothetical protein
VPQPYKMFRHALLGATLVFTQVCTGQGCEGLKMASAEEAASALDHGDIKTEDCSRVAFQLIEQLPKDEAIPILIRHLGFERPPSNAPHGLESEFPAVESLGHVGLSAEPPLVEFLAQNRNEGSIEHANAIVALAMIRHGDVVPTIKLLRQRSAALAGTPASARLEAAARYMLKTYCRGRRQFV